MAVSALRAAGAREGLGITLNLAQNVPASDDSADAAAARRRDGNENRLFLDPLFRGSYPEDMVAYYAPVSDFGFVRDGDLTTIAAPCDFLGINYYEKHVVCADPADPERADIALPPVGPLTGVGNGFDPDGLRDLLIRVSREYTSIPLYVTESGAAFHDYVTPEGYVPDDERVVYLSQHFQAAHEAITQGVDCGATSSGPSWTTLNGDTATPNDMVSCMSSLGRSSGRPSAARTGIVR